MTGKPHSPLWLAGYCSAPVRRETMHSVGEQSRSLNCISEAKLARRVFNGLEHRGETGNWLAGAARQEIGAEAFSS
jgi:hypothetical protein